MPISRTKKNGILVLDVLGADSAVWVLIGMRRVSFMHWILGGRTSGCWGCNWEGRRAESKTLNLIKCRFLRNWCLVPLRFVCVLRSSFILFGILFWYVVLDKSLLSLTGIVWFYCIWAGKIRPEGKWSISPATWKEKGDWVYVLFSCETNFHWLWHIDEMDKGFCGLWDG